MSVPWLSMGPKGPVAFSVLPSLRQPDWSASPLSSTPGLLWPPGLSASFDAPFPRAIDVERAAVAVRSWGQP